MLAPSASKRWINCPPSARLEEPFQTDASTTFAVEGTLAHEMAELTLRKALGLIDAKSFDDEIVELIESPFYYFGMDFEVDIYTDFCLERYSLAKAKYGAAEAYVEAKAPLDFIIKGDSGSVDFAVITLEYIEIMDLKFGKGVHVSAFDNPQLMTYAFGLYTKLSPEQKKSVKRVIMNIVQPRVSEEPSICEITIGDLYDFIANKVMPAADLALRGEGELTPGDWCKFCKAKVKCPALKAEMDEELRHAFAEPVLLTDDEIMEVYHKSKRVIDWLQSVSGYILKEALAGRKWPGLKIVEGKSNRKWANEEGVINTLKANSFTEDDYLNKKLKGIGEITKLVKKSRFEELLGNYVIKPAGSPTLAPESDPRPEMAIDAENVFELFEEESED